MRHTCAVCRWCTETNVKYFIGIIIGKQHDPRPRLFMAQDHATGIQVFDLSVLHDFIRCQIFYTHFLLHFLFSVKVHGFYGFF